MNIILAVIGVSCLLTALYYQFENEYNKATYFAVLGFGNILQIK